MIFVLLYSALCVQAIISYKTSQILGVNRWSTSNKLSGLAQSLFADHKQSVHNFV